MDSVTIDAASVGLSEAGFEVAVEVSGAAAALRLQETEFDLVVVDAVLPDVSGVALVRRIGAGDEVPAIVLGASSSEAERVLALEVGADDYVTKPFSPRELGSRGRAILRRVRREQLAERPVRTVGVLRVDLTRHEVAVGACSVDVTASEFRVLALLSGSPGRVFTRRQIMEHLWVGPYYGDGHAVDMHVLNLRRKIEADPTNPLRLLTVRGVGFRLVAPSGERAAPETPAEP
jgi:two-component system response regulator RegX3